MLNGFRLLLFLLPLIGWADEVIPLAEEDTGRFMGEFFKMLFVLGGMVAVLLAISWYMKRLTNQQFSKGNDDSLIKVIERRSLSARTMIYVLDIEGKTFVVGETPQGLVRLGDYGDDKT